MKSGNRASTDPVDLNMVPIMNLFLAIIPFLLMCAAFFQVSVINASVPALSEGTDAPNEEPPKQLDKVTVNLQIDASGFILSMTGDPPEEELKALGGTIPKKAGEFDYERLSERLKGIKDRYKKSDTVILLPAKEILYETLVKTMDASRERIVDKRLDAREYLFTNAVVSSVL